MIDTQSERGQLILAGAVSFALILIAIALVFSTTLFTASVGSSGTVETVADGTGTEQSVEHTTEGLLERVNQQNDWLLTHDRTFLDRSESSATELENRFDDNLSAYGRQLAASKAETGPTYVNVSRQSFNRGVRIKQDSFSSVPAVAFVNERKLDEFVMIVDVESSTDTAPLEIEISESNGGDSTYVRMEKNGDQLWIDSADSTGDLDMTAPECRIDADDAVVSGTNTVYVDLSNNFAAGNPYDPSDRQACPEQFSDSLDAPYDVAVTNTGSLNTAYEYTVNESGFSLPGTASSTDILWSTDVGIVYETSAVLRESETEVSGYDP